MTTGICIGESTVYHGDCLDVMAAMVALGVQVDSIVTDPPYHLSTVKRFGAPDAAPAQFGTDGAYARASRGFMGKEWDGGDVAFRPDTWRLAWHLLKPGGHMFAFSGSRTYHRMVCAIEDAGFEIRDQFLWLYGTGFPKSHDVSKAIDKAAGAERELLGYTANARPNRVGKETKLSGLQTIGGEITAPATDAARQWDGWGTAVKPAHEPIVLARKPLIGTVAENVLAHGTGALNIDASRVPTTDGYAENRVTQGGDHFSIGSDAKTRGTTFEPNTADRFPANVIHDGSPDVLEAFAAYGERPGQLATASTAADGRKTQNVYGDMRRGSNGAAPRGDSGTAARFFYSAKASARDRAGSKHPTVKPIDLKRYLATMITPPGGIVLDPFAGSGTTGAAWPRCILIEREAEYFFDILARLSNA